MKYLIIAGALGIAFGLMVLIDKYAPKHREHDEYHDGPFGDV